MTYLPIKSLQAALNLHYDKLVLIGFLNITKIFPCKPFEAFKSRKLLDDKVSKRRQHSSIFNLNISQDKFQDFEKANIILSKRGEGLRIGFHYHNTIDDLEHFLDFIRTL